RAYVHLVHEWEANAIRVVTKSAIEINRWHHLFVTSDGTSKAMGVRIYVDGKPAELEVTHDRLTESIRIEKPLLIGRRNPAAPFRGMIDEVRLYDRELAPAEVEELAGFDAIRPLLALAPEKRSAEQQETLARYFLQRNDAAYRKLDAELAAWRKKQA